MTRLRRRLATHAIAALTHPRTRALGRRAGEARRRLARAPHRVRYFCEVGDPYSHLAAQTLAELLARYAVELEVCWVGPPDAAAAPERAALEAFARKDAADVAPHYGLRFPRDAAKPAPSARECAEAVLAAQFAEGAPATPAQLRALAEVGAALWRGDEAALQARAQGAGRATPEQVRAQRARGDALRKRLGHYLSAMFHYGEAPGGEWYWGVDRLWHLERRLQALGLLRAGASPTPIVPRPGHARAARTARDASVHSERETAHAASAASVRDARDAVAPTAPAPEGTRRAPRVPTPAPRVAGGPNLTLEYFPSLRSPYTAIAMRRVLALAARWPVTLRLRPVLPMVMRGLPIPAAKRRYILFDTKREAEDAGEPYGRISDPVGRPVERGFALYPWACARGRGAEFLAAFTDAVFARGVDAGEDAGLRWIVERAGLSWSEACATPRGEGWRVELEENRRVLFALGLWGVPSFRILGADGAPDFWTWGQDRIWLVEAELRRRLQERHASVGA